jgi:hypothetical protein
LSRSSGFGSCFGMRNCVLALADRSLNPAFSSPAQSRQPVEHVPTERRA